MAEHKVAELDGALLDLAVAKAENFPSAWVNHDEDGARCILGPVEMPCFEWSPTEAWDQGGPIIDRELLFVSPKLVRGDFYGDWRAIAFGFGEQNRAEAEGETALVAAMRAYVASKFGEFVALDTEAGR